MTRSLLLAGGGLKVAFQAGVLQVLLDEAGLRFDHVDACSGGAFNAAMLCEGRTGTQIADAWRATRPRDGVSVHLRDLLAGRSLISLDGYRDRIFPQWALDWDAVRRSPLAASFNAYDITDARHRMFGAAEMDEDVLAACVSLPLWFPPVRIDGHLVTDAAFMTDADVEGAVDRGATEIWVVWTMNRRDEWLPGPLAQFFHALETSANGSLRRALDRLEASNADRRAGRPSRYDRCIEVHELAFEVPMHYLVVLGADRMHLAVERGVVAAREWCRREGRALGPPAAVAPDTDPVSLVFQDVMRGTLVTPAGDDVAMEARLQLDVTDIDRFTTDPGHRVRLRGTVTSALVGGRAQVAHGQGGIYVDDGADPTRKQMRYLLHLTDGNGGAWTLVGLKLVDSGNLRRSWSESTTLHTRLFAGHLPPESWPTDGMDGADGTDAPAVPAPTLIAAGAVRLGVGDVVRQVTTVDAAGGTRRGRLAAKARFAAMFTGHLWDVYARRVLSSAPF